MTRPSESTLPDVRWLTATEVADYLRVSRHTIHRWIDEKRLTAVKVGNTVRIPESSVKALLETPPTEDVKPG